MIFGLKRKRREAEILWPYDILQSYDSDSKFFNMWIWDTGARPISTATRAASAAETSWRSLNLSKMTKHFQNNIRQLKHIKTYKEQLHSTSMYQHDEHIRAREMSSCKSLDVEEKHVVVGIVVYISMPPLCQICLYLLFFLFLLFLSTCLVCISCVQTCSHHGHLGKPLYQQMASNMALQHCKNLQAFVNKSRRAVLATGIQWGARFAPWFMTDKSWPIANHTIYDSSLPNVAHPALRRAQGDDSQRSEVSYFFCLPGVHGSKNGTVELSNIEKFTEIKNIWNYQQLHKYKIARCCQMFSVAGCLKSDKAPLASTSEATWQGHMPKKIFLKASQRILSATCLSSTLLQHSLDCLLQLGWSSTLWSWSRKPSKANAPMSVAIWYCTHSRLLDSRL